MSPNISKYFEISIELSIYCFSFLVIFGCLFSILTIMVFSHAKYKKPKIAAKNYLKFLTISNSTFLVLHWFINTTQLIIVYYKIENTGVFFNIINLINWSDYSCKILNYLCNVTRSFSTFSTLSFSLQRAYAIYFPFKMIIFKKYSKLISIFSNLALVTLPLLISLPELYNYELVEFNKTNSNSSGSGEQQNDKIMLCDIKTYNVAFHTEFKFLFVIGTLLVPFIIIILSNIAIVIKLKRSKLVVLNYYKLYDQRYSKSSNFVAIAASRGKRVSETNSNLEDNYISNNSVASYSAATEKNNFPKLNIKRQSIQFKHSTIEEDESKQLYKINITSNYKMGFSVKKELHFAFHISNHHEQPKESLNLAKRNSEQATTSTTDMIRARMSSRKNSKFVNRINQIHNTKVLTLVTTFYTLLNLPYFINIFYIYLFYKPDMGYHDANLNDYIKYRYHTIMILSEILYVTNYSINGLLLFAFGKIYRLYLKSLVLKIFKFLNIFSK